MLYPTSVQLEIEHAPIGCRTHLSRSLFSFNNTRHDIDDVIVIASILLRYNVGSLLRPGSANVVAVEAFYWTAAQESLEVGCPQGEGSFCKDGSSTDLDPTNQRDHGGESSFQQSPQVVFRLVYF